MKRCIFIFFTSIIVFFYGNGLSQIVLSEVMYDPIGSEHTDEFVELFNLNDTDSVDLTGWSIGDGTDEDRIIGVYLTPAIAPQQYGLILDADYFESSDSYDALISENALILTVDGSTIGSGGLSNSRAETIMIFNSSHQLITEYTYSLENQPGHSDEKINLAGSDICENWSESLDVNGTPGFRNSVAKLMYDLSLLNLRIYPLQPLEGEDIQVHAMAYNKGTKSLDPFSIVLFEDSNTDSIVSEWEILDRYHSMISLQSGDSLAIDFIWPCVTAGLHTIGIKIDCLEDERLTNNTLFLLMAVGFTEGQLIVNEIMYDPMSDQPEWIEIYNRSDNIIDLKQWRFSDDDLEGAVLVSVENDCIYPSSFMVLAEDASVQDVFTDLLDSVLIVVERFPEINNDFDAVVLYDPSNRIVDQVSFSGDWGGGDGVSLERINHQIDSNNRMNWGSCAAFMGGTPGRENSLFTAILPSTARVQVSPSPFSPDGDGIDDCTIVTYTLPAKIACVNLRIFDVRGRCIRTLLGASQSGSSGSVIWNGRDDQDQIARIGIYIVFLEGLDSGRGVLISEKTTVVLGGIL